MSTKVNYKESLGSKNVRFTSKTSKKVSAKILKEVKKVDKNRKQAKNKAEKEKKAPKEPRAVLNKDDLPHWVVEPENTVHEKKRDKIHEVILLMAYLGLRVTEAIKFEWNKQEWVTDRWFFNVLGKGNKYRPVPNIFHNSYIKSKAELARKYPTLFEKQPFEVCRSGIFAFLARKKKKTQWRMDKPGFPAPHDFRRSFATRLAYEEDIDIMAIKDILGHEDIQTTQKYFKKDTRQLVSLLNKSGNKPD